jgi:hypothetical protein
VAFMLALGAGSLFLNFQKFKISQTSPPPKSNLQPSNGFLLEAGQPCPPILLLPSLPPPLPPYLPSSLKFVTGWT